jgi:hypothetical protein
MTIFGIRGSIKTHKKCKTEMRIVNSTDNKELAKAVAHEFVRRQYNPVLAARAVMPTEFITEAAAQAGVVDKLTILDLSRPCDQLTVSALVERTRSMLAAERHEIIYFQIASGCFRGANRCIELLRFRTNVGLLVGLGVPVLISWNAAAHRRRLADMDFLLQPFEWGIGLPAVTQTV